jgi:hypothetical protein
MYANRSRFKVIFFSLKVIIFFFGDIVKLIGDPLKPHGTAARLKRQRAAGGVTATGW